MRSSHTSNVCSWCNHWWDQATQVTFVVAVISMSRKQKQKNFDEFFLNEGKLIFDTYYFYCFARKREIYKKNFSFWPDTRTSLFDTFKQSS